LKTTEKFKLKSSPEISFFLSGFDSEQFKIFRSDFLSIDERFQSLKTEIDAFNQNVDSLIEKYLEEFEKPDEYLNNWNLAQNGNIVFNGKRD
jgi:hypothetical protein